MRLSRQALGWIGLQLVVGAFAACSGAEEAGERSEVVSNWEGSGGSTSSPTPESRVFAADKMGTLYTSSGFTPFTPVPVVDGTKPIAGHGTGAQGDVIERYITSEGKVFEKRNNEWKGVGSLSQKVVDVSSNRGGLSLALTESGQILWRTESGLEPTYVHNNVYDVKIGSNPNPIPIGRIDACHDGNVLAISKDGKRLVKFTNASRTWSEVSLLGFPGNPNLSVKLTDVACGVSDTGTNVNLVLGTRVTNPSLHRLEIVNGRSVWSEFQEVRNLPIDSRVDVDSVGHVWFIGANANNVIGLRRTMVRAGGGSAGSSGIGSAGSSGIRPRVVTDFVLPNPRDVGTD
jgi:hypothetical protein